MYAIIGLGTFLLMIFCLCKCICDFSKSNDRYNQFVLFELSENELPSYEDINTPPKYDDI